MSDSIKIVKDYRASLVRGGKESTCQCRRLKVDPWVGKFPLEKEMATDSSILGWEIPWTEEPGRFQSMELQKSWTQFSH